MARSIVIDGRRRSIITLPGYRLGMKPGNAGRRYPAEPLSRQETRELLAHCGRGFAGVRNRALIVIMWRCGLRVAEALALYPKDVDLATGSVRVLHGKGDRSRVVGIDPEAAAVVSVWLEKRKLLGLTGREPLFCVISRPTIGKPMYSSCVREMMRDAARKAGIDKRVHPHGLRHTYAAELANEGVPVHVIKAALGHSSLNTTARYVDHLAPGQVIDTMRARTWATESKQAAMAA